MNSLKITYQKALSLISLLMVAITTHSQSVPFAVNANLFDTSNQDSLGLEMAEGTETVTVFAPTETTDQFSNGAVMRGFNDYVYCMWQSSAKDEDAADTWVAYSRSKDGLTWTDPMELAASIEDGYCSSGGWWSNEDTLVAYINVWPSRISPRGGYTYYKTSIDGMTWSDMKPVMMANGDTLTGIFEQDPHALPDGRIINAVHFQPGIVIAPIYTDDPSGTRGWVKANFTNLSDGSVSREIEPSWYLRSNDTLVMIFRDQNSSYKKLAAKSGDRGENWTQAILTDFPDSRSKQSAGNIADSACYFASNPVDNKLRIPLVLSLSTDGKFFNTAYMLRYGGEGIGIQPLRFSGTAKRMGYHYPKSMIWNDTLYVSYTTNKEDVEFTRVPLKSLVIDKSESTIPYLELTENSKEAQSGEDTVKIKVASNIYWNTDENADWFKVKKSNNDTLLIICEENLTIDPRTDSIIISGSFVSPITVKITQLKGEAFLTVNPETEELSVASGSTSFDINSNIDWKFEVSASWLSATKTDENTLAIDFEENTSAENRMADISLSGESGEEETTITLTQLGTNTIGLVPSSVGFNKVEIIISNQNIVKALLQTNMKAELSIYNIFGQKVYKQTLIDTETRINCSAFETGTYIITVETEQGRTTKIFLKR